MTADEKTLRVLVVDDAPESRLLNQCLLRKIGAQVDVASGGKEALAKAEAAEFDLIFLDGVMPDLDGYQTAAELRARGYSGPLIILTAGREEVARDAACGITAYLQKPIDLKILKTELSRWTSHVSEV